MVKAASMCVFCKHRHEDHMTCDAFTKGIPKKIFFEYFDHRKPFPDDNDILFEPKEHLNIDEIKEILNLIYLDDEEDELMLTFDGKERNPFSRCGICKHFKGWKDKEGWANGIEICKAFPDGIPDDIWEEKISHDELYPGDNRITFEPKD